MVLRAKPEKKEEKERIASALLRATLQLAAAHGFSSLGLREVARAAEIAPTSFYRHFADMEELGLVLIRDLVKGFVTIRVERARAAASGAVIESLADEVLAGAIEDPELVRFVLAERVGAIPSFRSALARELQILTTAFQEAATKELATGSSDISAKVADAATVLLLEACARTLDQREQSTAAVRELFVYQVRTLLRGATGTGRHP